MRSIFHHITGLSIILLGAITLHATGTNGLQSLTNQLTAGDTLLVAAGNYDVFMFS